MATVRVQPMASPSTPSVRLMALLDPERTRKRKMKRKGSGIAAMIGSL